MRSHPRKWVAFFLEKKLGEKDFQSKPKKASPRIGVGFFIEGFGWTGLKIPSIGNVFLQ